MDPTNQSQNFGTWPLLSSSNLMSSFWQANKHLLGWPSTLKHLHWLPDTCFRILPCVFCNLSKQMSCIINEKKGLCNLLTLSKVSVCSLLPGCKYQVALPAPTLLRRVLPSLPRQWTFHWGRHLIAKREPQLNRAKYTWWLVCQTNFHRYANSTWTVLVGFSFVGGHTMKPSLVDFSRRSTTLTRETTSKICV